MTLYLAYSTPDSLAAIRDYLAVIIAAGTVVGGLVATLAYGQRRLRNLIIETTQPIQPHSNGGLSMTDLHGKVDRLGTGVDVVTEQQQAISRTVENRFAQIRLALLAVNADRDAIAEAIAAHLGVELPPSRLVAWLKDESDV